MPKRSELSLFDRLSLQEARHLKRLVKERDDLEHDRDRWRRALNDLTPGGSEFANDPENCVRCVQTTRAIQREAILKFKQRADKMGTQRDDLLVAAEAALPLLERIESNVWESIENRSLACPLRAAIAGAKQ